MAAMSTIILLHCTIFVECVKSIPIQVLEISEIWQFLAVIRRIMAIV
jgi:hypothetical protein